MFSRLKCNTSSLNANVDVGALEIGNAIHVKLSANRSFGTDLLQYRMMRDAASDEKTKHVILQKPIDVASPSLVGVAYTFTLLLVWFVAYVIVSVGRNEKPQPIRLLTPFECT